MDSKLNWTEGAESTVFDVEGTSLKAVATASYWGKMRLSEMIGLGGADFPREIAMVISLNR
jgi:hypothetical protein